MSHWMKLPKVLLVTTAITVASLSPALADAKDDRIAAMEAQMRIMMEEIQNLKTERDAEKQEQAALRQKVQQMETSTSQQISHQVSKTLANMAPAAGDNGDVKVTMKGGAPKITKGDFSWQPFGRIHLDAGSFEDDARDHPNGAEFRRARLGMKGKVAKDFGYKAEIDFANEGVALKDVYMNFTGIDNTELRLGHFKPGSTMENQTSSNDIVFIERASVVGSFGTSRQIGASVLAHGDRWHASAGVFNDDAGVQSTDDEKLSFSGRLAGTPIKDGKTIVHLGASALYQEPDQSNDRFDFDSKAENALQTVDSVSSVLNDGEDATIYGLEAAASLGPVFVQGEYLVADVENRGGQNPTFDGAYGQIAWALTGESRKYKSSKGAFKGLKPAKPFDLSKGQYGAFELAARYSHLDLNDGGINGGQMDNVTLGANWYLNDYMRFMANYIMVDTDGNATTPNDDPNILLFRSQVKF